LAVATPKWEGPAGPGRDRIILEGRMHDALKKKTFGPRQSQLSGLKRSLRGTGETGRAGHPEGERERLRLKGEKTSGEKKGGGYPLLKKDVKGPPWHRKVSMGMKINLFRDSL